MNKYLHLCRVIAERVCDGTWKNPGKRGECYKEGEAAEVFWGAIPECNMEASRSIEPFNSRLWNKNGNRSWIMDLGNIIYRLVT